MKTYRITLNVGSSKYVLSFHDGIKTYPDGSPFWDMNIFRNKRSLNAAVSDLKKAGYSSN